MNPAEAMQRLDDYAVELDTRSKELANCERDLAGHEDLFETYLDDFSKGLWDKHINGGEKLPGEELRLRLARTEYPTESLGRLTTLQHRRKRLERRIQALRAAASAQQSILGALKIEMEIAR